MIFNGRRRTGRLDLEAIEMAVRSAMHQAGAAALTELLPFPAPAADQRTLPCSCGRPARYRELRAVLLTRRFFSSRKEFHAATGVSWRTVDRSAVRMAVMVLRPAAVS